MLATLEQRLVHAEERALAISMGHLCTNADEEIRVVLEEVNTVREDLAHIQGPSVRELKTRADNVLIELLCIKRRTTPSIAA